MAPTQKNSYQNMMEHYDDILTGRKWWSKIYMQLIWKQDLNRVAKKILDFIPNDFQGQLLDVPVGTAVFTAPKYHQLKNARIIGLDYSEEMISIATLRKETECIENLSLVQGDVGSLPYADESFDVVLSMNEFQAFPDKEKAFAETFRVLKSGGCFCGCFYICGESRVTDFFVQNILEKKGFLHPPYDTFATAERRLRSMYDDNIEVAKMGIMCVFRCMKP